MSHATSLAVVRRPALDNPPPFDRERAERAVRELLLAVGENPDREGLLETPGRVARAYQELFSGVREDAGEEEEVGGRRSKRSKRSKSLQLRGWSSSARESARR